MESFLLRPDGYDVATPQIWYLIWYLVQFSIAFLDWSVHPLTYTSYIELQAVSYWLCNFQKPKSPKFVEVRYDSATKSKLNTQ